MIYYINMNCLLKGQEKSKKISKNCFIKFENEDIVFSNTQESGEHLANHMKMLIAFAIINDSRHLRNY